MAVERETKDGIFPASEMSKYVIALLLASGHPSHPTASFRLPYPLSTFPHIVLDRAWSLATAHEHPFSSLHLNATTTQPRLESGPSYTEKKRENAF